VAPEVRGQGVGARLLDDALAAARRNGATAAYLEVRDSNAAARALYASRGFEQVGRRRNYYRKPVEDALVMRRVLDAGARGGSA
jgi:[ribosomal protein S18]-alanine N-acetyltransferase